MGDIGTQKIIGIKYYNSSKKQSRTLPIKWSSKVVEEEYHFNNALVMAIAISRGIDFYETKSHNIIKKVENPEGLDIYNDTISFVDEEKGTLRRTLYINWTPQGISDSQSAGVIELQNRKIFASSMIRGIDNQINYIHLDDVAAYKSPYKASMDRIYAIGGLKNNKKLYYVNRGSDNFMPAAIDNWIEVGDFKRRFKSISIAFDGTYVSKLVKDKEYVDNYTGFDYNCESVLYIAWIEENTRKLYVQKGLYGKAILLADDADDCVSLERGYTAIDISDPMQDQGMVLAYISATGTIKTILLTINDLSYSATWTSDIEIKGQPKDGVNIEDNSLSDEEKYDILYTQTKPSYIQVHRLNDYRIGIEVTVNNNSVWHITDRNYNRMSIKPDVFNMPVIFPKFFYLGFTNKQDINELQPQWNYSYNNNVTVTIVSDKPFKIWDKDFDIKNQFSITKGTVKIKDVVFVKDNGEVAKDNQDANGCHIIRITLDRKAYASFNIAYKKKIALSAQFEQKDKMNYNAVGDTYFDIKVYIPPINTYGSDTFNMPVIYPKSFSFGWIRRQDLTADGGDTFNMPVIYPKTFTFDITFKGNTPVYGSDTFNMPVIYPKNMEIKIVIKGESPV